ncbi:MAG: rhodanese-like domain-containing protein [Anaerolineae bacterium]|nr:rhodanese-like domain-containing protein [Anaerolineae bacterium]
MTRKALFTVLAVIVIASLFAMPAAAQTPNPVQEAAEKYFAGGTKNIQAKDLFANLNDGDASNDPFMVDIRAPEDFANGHIKGAVNITGKALFTPEGLAQLPRDKQIVLNCYSGQTASQSTAALRMMGYDAYNLLYAVPSWGTNEKVTYPFTKEQSMGYAVSTEAASLGEAGELPAPLGATVEAAAAAYFAGGFKAVKASDVFANLNDGDTSNDPVILDTRAPEDYAAGHVPGAVNVNVKEMFTAANLAKLPADKQIVSYCYSGQTASQVTGALRLLGYDAYNMQFGMASWAIVNDKSTPVWDVSKSLGQPLEVTAAAAAAATTTTATAAAPATMPTTGAAFGALFLAGLAAVSAGFALRRR